MTSFFDLLISRRSIRKYLNKKIEPITIQKITAAALMSPTSKRTNSWEFVVVENPETMQQLADCRPTGSQLLHDAPLAIVVTADTTKTDVWFEDASIAAIIMQLQAHELGIGSCWVQVYNRQKDTETTSENYIKTLLNIPSHFGVLCIIALGYPDEQKKHFDTDALPTNKIHFEKF